MPRYVCSACKEEFDITRPIPYPQKGPLKIIHFCESANWKKMWEKVDNDGVLEVSPIKFGIAELVI